MTAYLTLPIRCALGSRYDISPVSDRHCRDFPKEYGAEAWFIGTVRGIKYWMV